MENRIKEQKLDLFADRTSTQTFESNQLRLWLSSIATDVFIFYKVSLLLKLCRDPIKLSIIKGYFIKNELHCRAYVLMQAFRKHCLNKTSLAQATVGTIRLNLMKLGAKITMTLKKVLIAISSYCPYQDILTGAQALLQAVRSFQNSSYSRAVIIFIISKITK